MVNNACYARKLEWVTDWKELCNFCLGIRDYESDDKCAIETPV